EALIEPEDEERLHDEAAAERVDAEERGELENDSAGAAERRAAHGAHVLDRRAESAVGETESRLDRRVEEEPTALRPQEVEAAETRDERREPAREGACGAGDRAVEV